MAKRFLTRRTRNLLTLAISAGIVSYYLLGVGLNQFLPTQPTSIVDTRLTPDNTAKDITVQRFDQFGALNYQLTASRADFYAEANRQSISDQELEFIKDFDDMSFDSDNHLPGGEPNDGTREYARLIKPFIQLYTDNKVSSDLRADLAYVTNNGENSELIGNVLVNDLDTATELRTHLLTMNVTLKQILTQKPVTVTTPTSITHAIGLQGNLTDQYWQLLSEVDSVVQP